VRSIAAALLAAVCATGRADTWNAGGLVSEAERRADVALKEVRLAALLDQEHLAGIVLTQARNHAWVLGGSDTSIVESRAQSPVWLLLARDGKKYLISNNVESARLLAEEGLARLGYEERRYPWFAGLSAGTDERWRIVAGIMGGDARLGADGALPGCQDLSAGLARIRFPLTPVETRRYRWLGSRVSGAVAATCRELLPGQRETEIAGGLAAKLVAQSITPTMLLVGSDARLMLYRHPVPTEARLKADVLVSVCAERWGLVIAIARQVHFGPLPPDLAKRMQACADVDAAYLHGARPGAQLKDVMQLAADAYARTGYPEEWRAHHQGGTIGYFECESPIWPDDPETVVEGMALSFSPTLPGVAVEDTILVGPHGPEILTRIPGWPVRKAAAGGVTFERPDLLVRSAP